MVQVARRVLQENGFVVDFPPGIDATIPAHDRTRKRLATCARSRGRRSTTSIRRISIRSRSPSSSPTARSTCSSGSPTSTRWSPRARRSTSAPRPTRNSLYTGVRMFPMLPEALALHRTSLLQYVEHLAVVTEFVVRADGSLDDAACHIYVARVINRAKLAYDHVGPWLEGGAHAHGLTTANGSPIGDPRVLDQLRLQDEAAQRLRVASRARRARAADGRGQRGRQGRQGHRSEARRGQSRTPADRGSDDRVERLDGAVSRDARPVVDPAREHHAEAVGSHRGDAREQPGHEAPPKPEQRARRRCRRSSHAQHVAAPDRFADLSLSIIKLIGPGIYALPTTTQQPPIEGRPNSRSGRLHALDGSESPVPRPRHAALAARPRTGRRPAPYTGRRARRDRHAAARIARSAALVERTMRKVAAATFLAPRIGEVFDSIITRRQHQRHVRAAHPSARRGAQRVAQADRAFVSAIARTARRYVARARLHRLRGARPSRRVRSKAVCASCARGSLASRADAAET